MSYDIIIGRNESDKKKFGDKGLVYIGKGFVKMGQYTSLSNKIFLDVVRTHVILVAGKRGSGKSYTLGVLAEQLSDLPKEVSQNIAPIIFDTMGIYWTMKYPNQKEKELLEKWELESQVTDII
jgi:ABC-type multidrug transport system ATPase subunit